MISLLQKYKLHIFAGLVVLLSCRKKTGILGVLAFFLDCWNNVWFLDPNDPKSASRQIERLKNLQELSKLLKEQKLRENIFKKEKDHERSTNIHEIENTNLGNSHIPETTSFKQFRKGFLICDYFLEYSLDYS